MESIFRPCKQITQDAESVQVNISSDKRFSKKKKIQQKHREKKIEMKIMWMKKKSHGSM